MITRLNNRTLLKLSGDDAQSFLQGQFSNDIDALEEGLVQLNAYCQHQGKIIALLWVMKQGKDFYLSFPNDLANIVIQRLTMFKMMSEVTITDVTDEIIQQISREKSFVIFVLWGKFANQKTALIDEKKHCILTASHPSPFSAYRGFFGCRHFSKINEILTKKGGEIINW